jgi:hypothetical protein
LCLTSVPKSYGRRRIIHTFACTAYEGQQACELRDTFGHFVAPTMKYSVRTLSAETRDAVVKFYFDPSISRVSPNARDTIYVRDTVTLE